MYQCLFLVYFRYLANKVKTTTGYRLILEPACTNVCFWYIPPSLRGQEETKEWWGKLGKVWITVIQPFIEAFYFCIFIFNYIFVAIYFHRLKSYTMQEQHTVCLNGHCRRNQFSLISLSNENHQNKSLAKII